MRPSRLILLSILFAGSLSTIAAEDSTAMNEYMNSASLSALKARTVDPKLDPKRIINESSSFLKEREPEMTAAENALYEKVVTMLGSNSDFAVKLLEAMMKEKELPSPAFEFILGNAYYNAGQTEKAETRYRSAVQRYPSFIRAWNNLGVLYYSAGKYADAVPCFSKSLSLGDRDPTTFGLLGFSLEKEGSVIPAGMAFLHALGSDPENADWQEGLLRICLEGKQYAWAESLLKNLVKQRPTESRYWFTYATILVEQNRPAEAIVLLESSVGMGTIGTDELTLLGDLYARQNLLPEALVCYQKLLATAPAGMGETKLLNFSHALIGAGRLPEALKVLDSLKNAQLTPEGQIELRQARSDLFAAKKQWAEARAELETLLKSAPFNGRALLSLGRAFAAENNPERATFAFEAAIRVPETTYLASLELANIELKNRHYSKSVDYLKKALSIEKTDAVEDYLARVKTLVVNDG